MEHYHPSLADVTKTGFFRQDVASQTDASEILDVKGMISLFNGLNEELNEARSDLNTATRIIKSGYETCLSNHLDSVCDRTNDRLRFIKETNSKNITRVRQSCRTQVANELARGLESCMKEFHEKLHVSHQEQLKTVTQLRETVKILKKSLQYKLDGEAARDQHILQLENLLKKAHIEVPEANLNNPLPIEDIVEDDGPQRELQEKQDKIRGLERDLQKTTYENEELRAELGELKRTVAKDQGKYEALTSELQTTKDAAAERIESLEARLKAVSDDFARVTEETANIKKTIDESNGARIKEAIRKNTQELHKQYKKDIGNLKQNLKKKEEEFIEKLMIMEKSVMNVQDASYVKTLMQKQGTVLKYATLMQRLHPPALNNVDSGSIELASKGPALPAIDCDSERHVHFKE